MDCAAFYKNQALVGEGLREFLGSGRRGELFITSKIWTDEHRPDALRRALYILVPTVTDAISVRDAVMCAWCGK